MNAQQIEDYVRATLDAQGLNLSPEQVARVVVAFTRNAGIAQLVVDFALDDGVEADSSFQP